MNLLRSIYSFITGGSIVAPIGLAAAIVAASLLPAWRTQAFIVIIAVSLAASVFEKAA